MNPTPDTPTPPASPAASAEQPAAPVTFTAEQVAERERAAAQKAHDAAMAEARRVFEGKQKPSQSPAPQPTPTPAPSAGPGLTFADLARFQAFNAAAADHGIPPAGVEMLLEQWGTAKPTDTRAWVGEQAAKFGWQKTAPTSTPQPGASPTQGATLTPNPTATPTPTPGGSLPAPSSQYRKPVHEWSQAELDAYAAKNGGPASIFRLFGEDASRMQFRLGKGNR